MPHEDPADYEGSTPVDVEEAAEAPPTVTVLLRYETHRKHCWTCSLCPPTGVTMPWMETHAETLSEALAALAESVEEWEDSEDFHDDDWD